MKLSADKRSMRNPGARSSSSWSPPLSAPAPEQLWAAAAILNRGSRVAVLAGQGALSAREEVAQLADVLGAPVAKALLGKAVLPDDSPFTTGGIGDLGTAPSSWAMQNCDTVLILGSTMPWEEYYPKPGQARGVQVDLKPDRLGLRYPVEIGLTGDVKATLQGLMPLLTRKSDRSFLQEAQRRMTDFAVRDGFVGHSCRLSITTSSSWSRMASPAGMACNRGESRRWCVRTGPRRRCRETALGMTARPGNARFPLIRPGHAPAPRFLGGRR